MAWYCRYFFYERIQFEEDYLMDFFGNDYGEYKDRVRSGLPCIK